MGKGVMVCILTENGTEQDNKDDSKGRAFEKGEWARRKGGREMQRQYFSSNADSRGGNDGA